MPGQKILLGMLVLWLLGGLTGCGPAGQESSESEKQILWKDVQEYLKGQEEERVVSQLEDGSEAKDRTQEEAWETEGLAEFEEAVVSPFAYESLTEAERLWYRDMNRTLGNLWEKQELSQEGLQAGLTESDIDRIFQCVLNDHPEYFYVEGYTYTRYTRKDEIVKLEFSGSYAMTGEQALERREQIRESAGELLKGIDSAASDYEKIKYVYETIISNTEYDLSASDNQNIYSVLVNKASVCQGYAKATQYLLNSLGVECTLVVGTVDTGEGHAWNLVKADGSYYYVDTTWGDASYLIKGGIEEESRYLPKINYDYLCVTTEQLLRTHTLGGVVPMPVCQALTDNYYVKEGVYFTDADQAQIEEVFERAGKQDREDITLKCADSAVYEEVYRLLVEEQGIFEYLESGAGRIAYTQNEKQLSITFWMTNE